MIFFDYIDMVKNLLGSPTRYGFESLEDGTDSNDPDLCYVLDETVSDIAKLKYMIPVIGETRYNEIAARQDQSFTTQEKYLAYADLYFALAIFLEQRGQIKRHESEGTTETYNSAGISRTYGSDVQLLKSAKDFLNEAYTFLELAGYRKRCNISRNGIISEWVYNDPAQYIPGIV